MSKNIGDQEQSKLDFLGMSVEEAKQLGQNYGAFISGLRAEILNEGLPEDEVTNLLKNIVPLGKCKSGTMCRIWT